MRYREIINELFDKSANWQWLEKHKGYWVATFTIGENQYAAAIDYVPSQNIWDLSFDMNGKTTITGTGNEYEVFATIKNILFEFIDEMDPIGISFGSHRSEKSRYKLYDRMAKQLETKFGYELTYGVQNHYKMFYLRKPDSAVNESILINELFNEPLKWEISNEGPKYFEAQFDVGDSLYTVEAETFGRKWEIVFSNNGNMGLTGTGREFEVFATIRQIFDRFLTQYQPEQFFFSASKKEASRVSLYTRMANQISKTYGYHLLTEDKALFNEKWFTFIKDGAHSEIQ